MRTQKRLRKKRKRASGYFNRIVKAAIRSEARRYNVSESFVIVNCCAFALGISIEESYKR